MNIVIALRVEQAGQKRIKQEQISQLYVTRRKVLGLDDGERNP